MKKYLFPVLLTLLAAASGAPVNNEKNGWREIAIFKSGVTL